MSEKLGSDIEYVGDFVEPEDAGQPFRPASDVGVSELEVRQTHGKPTKIPSKMPLIQPSISNVASKSELRENRTRIAASTQIPQTASFALFRKFSTRNIMREMKNSPKNSAELLRAEEIEMELLNHQREIELNYAKKLMLRSKPSFHPETIEFKPEQFQDIYDDECKNSARDPQKIVFHDSADVSRYPSYSRFELPYHMTCLNRYKEKKLKYEMQFRYELETLQEMQPTAYEAARFAMFLGPRALRKMNYSPRTVKFTPKERRRLQYLLREEQR